MKKEGKYRYTLQFPADTEEHIRAGELLERLGNRKSAVIVAAVNEYLADHPDLANTGKGIRIEFHPGRDRSELEQLIRALLEEKLAALGRVETLPSKEPEGAESGIEAGIAQMLDNLELFS